MSGAPLPIQPPPPLRFADFFFQCGLSPDVSLADRRVLEDGSTAGEASDKESRSRHLSDGVSPMHLPQAKLKRKQHPLDWRYAPEVLCRYPAKDYSERERFPTYLPMFCFPNNIQLSHEDAGPPAEKYHSFIITEETGAKCYGVCLTLYEKLTPKHAAELEMMTQELRMGSLGSSDLEYIQHIQSQLAENKEALLHARMGIGDTRKSSTKLNRFTEASASTEQMTSPDIDTAHTLQDAEEKVKLYRDLLRPLDALLADAETVYAPRTIGVLSHWPWHDFLKDWLCEVLRVTRGDYDDNPNGKVLAPLERFVTNLIHELPLPPPGKLELSIHVGQLHFFCSRPPVNSISVLKNFSLYPIFRALSKENIVTVFELILSERKIIFVSQHLSMLTLAAETFCLFFFPLFWQHIFIPVLPCRLLTYLQAPMPYIVGVQKEYFTAAAQDEWKPPDATVVDLDLDSVVVTEEVPRLPPRERRKLLKRLEKATGGPPHSSPHAKHGTAEGSVRERGVPITCQQAMVFGKHAPLSCESASRRKVMPAKDQHHRSRAASETPYSSEPKSRASSFYLSPSGGNGVTGAWLDKLNRHFTGNGPSPATAHASTFSLSSNSSTDERYAGGSWWGASRDESHGDDTRSVMTTDTASLSRASMASRASPDRVASPSISEPGAISRLRSPFFSKRSESKLEEKQPSMKQLPSNASLTSMFSHFTSSNNPRKGSAARPPVHVPSHRASISAASTSSSATANTTLSSIYPQMQMDENMPTRHGIPLKKKEGHLFYPVPVKSSWSRTNVDEIPSSVPDGEGDAKAAPSVHGTLEEDPRSLQKSVSASSASLTYTKPTSANPLIRLADAKRRENRLSTARRGGGGSRWKSHEVLIDEGTPQHAASATSVSLPHRRRSSGTNSVNSSLALVTVELGAVCRVCREDLVGQENTVVLQCEVCPMVIHPMCLSMTESVPCPTSFDEARIQKAFLKVFTSLMRHYRQHLATPEQLNQNGATPLTPLSDGSENSVRALDMDALQEEWFRKDQFLAACEKDARPFMTQFVDTQAFAQFTLDRVERPESDYEVLFFDESIKEKRNRSRLHLGKDSTPFLKETAYDVRSTILCLDASVDNIEAAGTRTYSTCGMPVKMDEELFGTPRHVQPLITPSDHRMMRSMTNELVQRARIATTMRRKQDFSKWMRSKWKHFQKVGGGEVVSLGFLSDEQRRELLEERIEEVTSVIDQYEQRHLSSQTASQVHAALEELHAQNLVLMQAADEEQLVDTADQEDLQLVYARLFRVITIYEDFLATLVGVGQDKEEGQATDRAADIDEPDVATRPPVGDSDRFRLRISIGPGLGNVSDWLLNAETGYRGEGERDLSDGLKNTAKTSVLELQEINNSGKAGHTASQDLQDGLDITDPKAERSDSTILLDEESGPESAAQDIAPEHNGEQGRVVQPTEVYAPTQQQLSTVVESPSLVGSPVESLVESNLPLPTSASPTHPEAPTSEVSEPVTAIDESAHEAKVVEAATVAESAPCEEVTAIASRTNSLARRPSPTPRSDSVQAQQVDEAQDSPVRQESFFDASEPAQDEKDVQPVQTKINRSESVSDAPAPVPAPTPDTKDARPAQLEKRNSTQSLPTTPQKFEVSRGRWAASREADGGQ